MNLTFPRGVGGHDGPMWLSLGEDRCLDNLIWMANSKRLASGADRVGQFVGTSADSALRSVVWPT